ncbi:MAG: hypothetical protein ACE5LX_09685, partial [Nitrospinota bacterium]
LYPYQVGYVRELVEALGSGRGVLSEKTRQMGLSWLTMAFFLWGLTFMDGFSALCISRREAEVDDGGTASTPKSLFGRLRFMWERLPDFLRVELIFRHLAVRNPRRDSFLVGESANPNAGRGGSFLTGLWDEAAHTPRSEAIWEAFSQAVRVPLLSSTPNGRANAFARLRFSEGSTLKKLRFHWREHPERDEAWYQAMRRDMTEEQVAQELDISYERSTVSRVYPEFDYAVHVRRDIAYDPTLPLYCAWDFGLHDPTVILWVQTDPNDIAYIIDEYRNRNKPPDHYAQVVRAKPYKEATHYGDPAGRTRDARGGSWIAYLREHGIHIRYRLPSALLDGIAAVKRKLVRKELFVYERCTAFIDAIESYRWEEHAGGRAGQRPLEDEACHVMDALRYFVLNRYPLITTRWDQ